MEAVAEPRFSDRFYGVPSNATLSLTVRRLFASDVKDFWTIFASFT